MQLIAINKTHQSKVNRAIKVLEKYNKFNDLRNEAEDNSDEYYLRDDKNYRRWDNLCEIHFNKYLEIVSELPQREVSKIESLSIY